MSLPINREKKRSSEVPDFLNKSAERAKTGGISAAERMAEEEEGSGVELLLDVGCSATFDSAHRLMNYDGKCSNLHGHTFHLKIRFAASELREDTGISYDFSDLKSLVNAVCNMVDHKVLLHKDDPLIPVLQQAEQEVVSFDFHPSAEQLAVWFGLQLRELGMMVPVVIELAETPNNWVRVSL